jgi:hypothetical protein
LPAYIISGEDRRVGRLVVAVVLGACAFRHGRLGADGAAEPDAAVDVSTDAAGARVTSGLIAFYDFSEASGSIAHDTSAVSPALDLKLPAAGVSWLPGAIRFDQASIVSSSDIASKLATRCNATGEVTTEAWLVYGTLPGWSRIIAYSATGDVGNFAMTSDPTTIGFDLTTSALVYDRTTMAVFTTAPPPGLHHMVNVRDATGDKRIYLDNTLVIDAMQGGDFSSWNATYVLSIGNTPAMDRAFYGEVHLVAIYERALTAAEVAINFAAGADP